MISAIQNYNSKKQTFGTNLVTPFKFTQEAGQQLSNVDMPKGFITSLFTDLPMLVNKIIGKTNPDDKMFLELTDVIKKPNIKPYILGNVSLTRGDKTITAQKPVKVNFIKNSDRNLAPNGYTFELDNLISTEIELAKKIDKTA